MSDLGPRESIPIQRMRERTFDRLDVQGKSVLDIGGCEGAVAAYLLGKGAASATVVDNQEYQAYVGGWEVPPPYPGVRYATATWYDWKEPADIVVAGNIFYHDPNPWRLSETLRSLTKEACVIWTRIHLNVDEPVWQIQGHYSTEERVGAGYWECSESGLTQLLEETGWSSVERVGRYEYTIYLIVRP